MLQTCGVTYENLTPRLIDPCGPGACGVLHRSEDPHQKPLVSSESASEAVGAELAGRHASDFAGQKRAKGRDKAERESEINDRSYESCPIFALVHLSFHLWDPHPGILAGPVAGR